MNIERALATPGFMAEVELEYIASLATKSMIIAEVGSWSGRSARAWSDNTEGFIVCCDTWADNAYGSAPAEQTGSPNWLYNAFRENTLDCDNIVMWRMNSVDGAAKAAKFRVKFDAIFIDAGHNYEDVVSDIRSWTPSLATGGVLCGHDYAEYHPGVVQAVNELVPDFRVVGTIWTTEAA